MSLLIKIQIWRGDTMISEDMCPVYPDAEFRRSFGPLGNSEPIIDGNVALRGYKLTQDTVVRIDRRIQGTHRAYG